MWACANLTKSKPCESGKFKQVAGSANCEWCGPNSESEEGEPLCACVAGFSLSDSGDCIACEPGTFQSGTDKDLGHAKCAQQENTKTVTASAMLISFAQMACNDCPDLRTQSCQRGVYSRRHVFATAASLVLMASARSALQAPTRRQRGPTHVL